MSMKSAYKMLPHEIVEAKERSSCAFIPVSPCFEWHSYHLPFGTDALIAEGLCRAIAERVGGIYFEPLSFGLDSWRTKEQLAAWGFSEDEKVYGMRFPELPVFSEYCGKEEMAKTLENRLDAVKATGFKYAFLVNNHGGEGQIPLLQGVADKWNGEDFKVFSIKTYDLLTYSHPLLRKGGHAGQSETLLLMAFHPELVDLTRLPEGALSVRKFGILHSSPEIEPEANPRHVLLSVANEIRRNLLDNFGKFILERCGRPSKGN